MYQCPKSHAHVLRLMHMTALFHSSIKYRTAATQQQQGTACAFHSPCFRKLHLSQVIAACTGIRNLTFEAKWPSRTTSLPSNDTIEMPGKTWSGLAWPFCAGLLWPSMCLHETELKHTHTTERELINQQLQSYQRHSLHPVILTRFTKQSLVKGLVSLSCMCPLNLYSLQRSVMTTPWRAGKEREMKGVGETFHFLWRSLSSSSVCCQPE